VAAVVLVALVIVGRGLNVPAVVLDLIVAPPPRSGLGVAEGVIVVVEAVVVVPSVVGAAIVVPMWMHRAYRNLPALGEQAMRWSPAWALGGWFVPFANLVIPYLCLRELWNGFGDERPLPQLHWAAWIGIYVLSLLSGFVPRTGARQRADVFGILTDVAVILAGFLLTTMIWRVSRGERDRETELHGC